MKKELLQLLRNECVKREFITNGADGRKVKIGMCVILVDMQQELIINTSEYYKLHTFLAKNKPSDAKSYNWYPNDDQGNKKRIEFLNKWINRIIWEERQYGCEGCKFFKSCAIRIESEEDLPKELIDKDVEVWLSRNKIPFLGYFYKAYNGLYYSVCNLDSIPVEIKGIHMGSFKSLDGYQPIIKPEPPIY